MEVVLSAPAFSSSVKRKNLPPLSQLVEDSRKTGHVPHHLLDTRVFTKLKSNGLVEAEPSDLHFSGFEVGKDYKKILKLVNISSEALSVHILPPQTKNFQIKYTKKYRLLPGLAYTVTVHFHPDEWRYFCDSIRIHCSGEENLLVPLHAYPVINDLHIPSYINLPPVPLGQSASHVIPLSCSCPVDFEFQVHCLQHHQAFTVEPLSGIIPANGGTELRVTFTPLQYGTADITLQLLISQFNSKPVIWTVTGSSSPYLPLSKPNRNGDGNKVLVEERKIADGKSVPIASHKLKRAPAVQKFSKRKSKTDPQPQTSTIDVTTHAGLVKMLMQPQDKMRYKDLREALSYTKTTEQTKEMKEAAFLKKVQQNEEKAHRHHWQTRLGQDPCSTEQKLQILKEQDEAVAEYKRKYSSESVDFTRFSSKLSSQRILRKAGQLPECTVFCSYGNGQLEVRQRALRLFQQAARKVVLQCRMNKRLVSLRKLVHNIKSRQGESDGAEKPNPLKLTPEKLLPFSFPVFMPENQPDELAVNSLGRVPVKIPKVDMKLNTPLFSLKVPQHYRLMGYQRVNIYDAVTSFIPSHLNRTLRTGAQDELLPIMTCPSVDLSEDEEESKPEEDEGSVKDITPNLSFIAPDALLKPPNAHPLRIFNPAPHVYGFKAAPLYLETDLDFHLCPLPRHSVNKSSVKGTPTTQRKYLTRTDIIKGIMTWKKFPSVALSTLSNMSAATSDCIPRMSDPFSNILLPLEGPPVLRGLPDSLRQEIQSEVSESSQLCLIPEMLQAEFGLYERSSATSLKKDGDEDSRETCEQPLESAQNNRLGRKVLDRFKHLKSMGKADPSSRDST